MLIGRGHVEKHAAQPIVGDGRNKVRNRAELGAGESGGDRIAAEGDGIILRHRLFIAARNSVAQQGDIDISVADEKRLQRSLGTVWRNARIPSPGGRSLSSAAGCAGFTNANHVRGSRRSCRLCHV